jgi:hypothetical protein
MWRQPNEVGEGESDSGVLRLGAERIRFMRTMPRLKSKVVGLTMAAARGIEGPKAIYSFDNYKSAEDYLAAGNSLIVEFYTKPLADRFLQTEEVPPAQILGIHERWHSHYRYAIENGIAPSDMRGLDAAYDRAADELEARALLTGEDDAGVLFQTDTPAFKEWFKESEIVNPDGTPRIVYHGSRKNFDRFNPEVYDNGVTSFALNPELANTYPQGLGNYDIWPKGNRNPDTDPRPIAKEMKDYHTSLYYEYGGDKVDSSDPDFLAKYLPIEEKIDAEMIRKYGFKNATLMEMAIGLQVYPAYLSVQNLFDPRRDGKSMEKFLMDNKIMGIEMLAEDVHLTGSWLVYEETPVIEELKRRGFDGVIIQEKPGGEYGTINVFSPTQIKSVFNKGTWDADDPRILFQLTGLLEGKEVSSIEARPYRRAFRRVLDAGTDDERFVTPLKLATSLAERF